MVLVAAAVVVGLVLRIRPPDTLEGARRRGDRPPVRLRRYRRVEEVSRRRKEDVFCLHVVAEAGRAARLRREEVGGRVVIGDGGGGAEAFGVVSAVAGGGALQDLVADAFRSTAPRPLLLAGNLFIFWNMNLARISF